MNLKTIDDLLSEEIRKKRSPSVQYFCFTGDKLIHSFKGGFADVQNQIPVTASTTYNVYSITKTIVALAFLQLAEKGLVDIEKPAKEYWPEFPYPGEITLKQLLSHTAGFPNPLPLNWAHPASEESTFDYKGFVQEVIRKNPKTSWKPNEKMQYNHMGHIFLGEILERVSGISFQEYVCKNILNVIDPGRKESDFTLQEYFQQAKGYHRKGGPTWFMMGWFIDKKKFIRQTEGKWKAFHPLYVNGPSYAGLIASPNVMVNYAREMLNPESALISAASKKLLFTETVLSNGKPSGAGLSWFKGELNGHRYFAHAGSGGGYYTEVRVYPERGIGSVVMINRTRFFREHLLNRTDGGILG